MVEWTPRRSRSSISPRVPDDGSITLPKLATRQPAVVNVAITSCSGWNMAASTSYPRGKYSSHHPDGGMWSLKFSRSSSRPPGLSTLASSSTARGLSSTWCQDRNINA